MPIYSKKVIASLRDFLVMGFSRKEACSRNDVSPAYLLATYTCVVLR
ncbi:PapB/FocB family fimbrial expression transcriptional regulator (plasmid) [Escherichia albertii]|nr:PapB/FocB family fimbrial expression transcriptional regulator [Escherichia albertii]WDC09066.1 PapB/FocB family fimbrial expression transcriptional regulator [Escherichia albertii]